MSERVFAIRIREVFNALPGSAKEGELLVSAEAAGSILDVIHEDVRLFGRNDNKLVHPDD